MGTFSSNILPSATGEDLGSPTQRWDLFAQSVDLSSGLNVLGASTVTNLNNIRYANAFTGADASLQIQAAIADLPSTGGTVDARGLEGSQTCTVNPFAAILNTNKSVRLLLGFATFTTNVPWQIPQKCEVWGSARGDVAADGTVIKASSSFSGTGVVIIGDGAPFSHGAFIRDVTVDVNSKAGVAGIYTNVANELSGAERVKIQNVGTNGWGLYVQQISSTNIPSNYTFRDFEIYFDATATGATGVEVAGILNDHRGFDGITVNGAAAVAQTGTVGIRINGASGIYSRIHVERVVDGIVIGDKAVAGGTNAPWVLGVTGHSTVTNLIRLENTSTPLCVVLGSLKKEGGTNVIKDNINSVTITDEQYGFYPQGSLNTFGVQTFNNAGTGAVNLAKRNPGNDTVLLGDTSGVAFQGNVNANGHFFFDGSVNTAAGGLYRLGSAQTINFRNNANGADVNGLSKDTSDIVQVGDTAGIKTVGPVTKYNNISTVSNGVPAEYATVDLTAQGAAITTATLYAVPASGVGQYRVQWNAKITTVDAVSSTLGALTIGYTDPDGVALTMTAPATILAGTIATSSTGNVTSTALMGLPLMLNCKASTNVTYAFAYVSNTPGQMKFNLHLKLEAL